MQVWEDLFEIYKSCGGGSHRIASNMDIYDATLFIRVWMQENFNDQATSLEIRRQPMEAEEGEEA